MTSPSTTRLAQTVEQTTGFKVVIDTVAGIAEDAQMLSARPEMPVHSIRVNQARLPFADCIVAIQCAILLRLWSNPSRIPVFHLTDATDDLAANLVTTAPGLARLPASSARNTADHFVRGLLHQLCSMPVEILAINDCFASCPDLRDLQTECVSDNLRRLSQNLSPEIRAFAPESMWRNSVSMSSAYALNWSRLTDSTLALLPYQSAGFSGVAEQLVASLDGLSARNSDSYTQAVDAWAVRLNLRSLYVWEYRSAIS